MAFQSKAVDLDLAVLQLSVNQSNYLSYQTALIDPSTNDIWEGPMSGTYSPDSLPQEVANAIQVVKNYILGLSNSDVMTKSQAVDSKIAVVAEAGVGVSLKTP